MSRLFALLFLLVAASPPARAQADPRDQLESVRLDERSVLDQLNAIDRDLQTVRDRRTALEEQLRGLEDSARRHEDDASVAEAQLAQLKPQVKGRVRALYRLHQRGLARIVFGAEDPAELRRRSVYLLAILRADLARLLRFSQVVRGRDQARQDLQKDLGAITGLKTEVQLAESELLNQRASKLALLNEIRTQRAVALQALEGYGQVQRDLQRDFELASRATAVSLNPGDNFRDEYGRLAWPGTGQLIRRFGPYRDPLTGEEMNSLGIEIAAEFGTPIRAVFDGVVKLADFIPGYGQTVALDHGPYNTVYFHANGLQVRRGDSVRRGEVIGMVGNSGLTDGRGYVLGFELRYNGTPQDPLPWLAPR